MSSTLATGGAGIHFESRVAASFLGSVLCKTGARRLPEGVCAVRVELQRAFEGDSSSLDDVIVYGTSASGGSRLTLQVKRDLSFGNSQLFKDVIADCWKTFCSPEFVRRSDRFGVAIGKIAQAVEKGGREVLALARSKADAPDFLDHLEKQGVASEGMRSFADNIRNRLDENKGSPVTDTEFWEFLAHFRIEYYDFEQGDSSDLHSNIAALKAALIPSHAERAPALWDALVALADEHKPAAGSLTRDTLVELLHHRFRLSGLRQNAEDLERIATCSDKVLKSIRVNLGNIHLDRDDTLTSLIHQSNECQFVETTSPQRSGC